MKKKLHTLFAFLFLVLASNTNIAQIYTFTNYSSTNGLVSNKSTAILQDSRGYLWIGTEIGLSRFDGNSFVNYDKFHGLSENAISGLKQDGEGNLYVFHPNNRITKISNDYSLDVEDSTKTDYHFIDNSNLTCKIIDKKSIKILNKKKQVLFHITTKNGLVNDEINSALVDRENILWIATKKNGIYSLPLQNFPSYKWEYGSLVNSYQLNNETHLLTFKNNIVKMRFNGEKPTFSTVFTNKNKVLNCAIIQYGNELFYGTNQGMFLYFNETKTEFSFNELTEKNVTHIEKLGNGDLLIIADNRIYMYVVYTNEINLFPGLANFQANSLQKLNNEIYLLGKGNIYQLKNKKFNALLSSHKIARSQNFVHIAEGTKGTFWLSSDNGGLFYHSPEEDKLENFNQDKNIPLNSAYSSLQDENNLWITTKSEIVWYDITKNTFSRFGSKYLNSTNFLPFTIKNKKNLYFTTKEGLVQTFDSKSFVSSSNILNITNMFVQGKTTDTDSIIEVKYNSFPIQFDYQSISLKEKTYYQIKLEGKDEEWSNSTLKTSISYPSLGPGNYTFRVRTVDPINEVVLNTDKLEFTVLLPYWKTAYFIYILLGILAFFIFLFYLFRVWTLKKRAIKLEKLIDEKTYVLSAQNQNIEQFSYSLSHDLKNPINNIKGLVEIMEESEDDSQNEIRKLLMSSAQLLEDKIKATLKTIKQMQANKKNVELLYFNNIMNETKRSLLMLIKNNDVKFNTHFKANSIQYSSSILESIFYNLMSNSIKYGSKKRKTIIDISARKEGEIYILEFEDNGIGMDMEKDLEKVFSIFERVDDENATGTGLGLYMVKQMIELNGGSISVTSELDKGTKFTIKLTPME